LALLPLTLLAVLTLLTLLALLSLLIASLALLPLLTLLAVARLLLALLSLLAVLPVARLLLFLPHPFAERLQAAHEIARLVGGASERVLLRLLAERRLRLADLALQRVEVALDVVFHRLRVVARRSAELAA